LQHQADVQVSQKLRLLHLLEAFELEHVYVIFVFDLGHNIPSHPSDKETWLVFKSCNNALITWLFPTCANWRKKSYSNVVLLKSFNMTWCVIHD